MLMLSGRDFGLNNLFFNYIQEGVAVANPDLRMRAFNKRKNGTSRPAGKKIYCVK